MRIPLFIGPSHTSQSRIADAQRTMNWIPEVMEEQGSKARVVLYPTPGLGVAKATFAEAPGRAISEVASRCFTVQGGAFYELSSTYGATKLNPSADMAVDNNPATIANNGEGKQIFITSGGAGYLYDFTDLAAPTFTTVLTGTGSDHVTVGDHLDGFFLALNVQLSQFRISGLSNGATWDGLDFVQRSDASDPWKGMISQGGEIWLIGTKTGGVWYNAGTSPFPFALRTESFFEVGLLATFSLARFDNSIAWLGASEQGRGIVYRASGYTPVRISTHPIEEAIHGYAVVDDAVGWSYEDRGHIYYVLDFPTAGATWVYDASTKMWHERGKWDTTYGIWRGYRARYHANAFNRHLVCDWLVGGVYELSSSVYTDAGGDILRRARRTSHVANENKQITIDQVEIELERGIGLIGGSVARDPTIMFRASRDGGRTWMNQRALRAGQGGEYSARAITRRLGSGRDWVFEIAVTDPVPWRIIDGYMEARAGAH